MDKKMWLRVAIASFLILVIGTVSWQVFITPNSKQLAISKVEAQELAEDRYEGEIINTKENTNGFIITIQSDTGEYEISISRNTGEVEEIIQIKEVEKPTQLTEKDVKEIVLKETPGTIEDMSKSTENEIDYYDAVVKDDQKTVIVKVNGETGDIIEKNEQKNSEEQPKKDKQENDKQVAKKENEQKKQQEKEEKQEKKEAEKKKEKEKEKVKNISEAEAIKIALDTVYGEVDDVDLESSNGQLYYFIEIETEDDLEAEIQIHAITGKVVSIEWDD